MIDHNFKQYGIDEFYVGDVVLPSERGNSLIKLSLREFVQMARRAYSANTLQALKDSDGINIIEHTSTDLNNFDCVDEIQPFVHFKITFAPRTNDLQTFLSNGEFDLFLSSLLTSVGHSSKRRFKGNRTAFVGKFDHETNKDGLEVMVSHVFMGTSVFFNDYRVTTNYPASQDELDAILESIFYELDNEFDVFLEVVSDEDVMDQDITDGNDGISTISTVGTSYISF